MKSWLLAVLLGAPAAAAQFDGVTLVFPSGGVLKGVLLGEDAGELLLEVDGGSVQFSRDSVSELRREPNAHSAFKAREAEAEGAGALWELARWADANGLPGWARASAERVLALEPEHGAARAFLGYRFVAGAWRRGADLMRAQGLVAYEGGWLSVAERAAALERESEEAERREEARFEAARMNSLVLALERLAAKGRPEPVLVAPVRFFGGPLMLDLPRFQGATALNGPLADRTWRPERFQTYRPALGIAPMDPVGSRFGFDPMR